MEFLNRLLTKLLNLTPWYIVFADQAGVFLRFGRYKRTLKSGFYWKIPILDNIWTLPSIEQIINLPNQSIRAKDGKNYAVSGVIRYDVSDAKKALLCVYNWDASLQNMAMGIIANYVTLAPKLTPELIEKQVFEELSESAENWGINVIEFSLTDFAEHRIFRLMTADAPSIISREGS